MSDYQREITGEFNCIPLLATGSVEHGPYRAFKILGADNTVTTEGKPVLTAVSVQQGDVVNGDFTKIAHGGQASSVLIPYESAYGFQQRYGMSAIDKTTHFELETIEPANLDTTPPGFVRLSAPIQRLPGAEPIDQTTNPTYVTLNLDAKN